MLLAPPRFGGIKERYTRTHAGEVHRLLDPIRKCFREFPDELHYENFLLHFLDPEVATILIGDAMPRHVKHAVAQPRKAQFYRFRNRGPVLHEIIVDGPAPGGERWAAPGIRVCTRTAREIRACTVTLEVLDAARRLMALPDRPRTILCANDSMALGAMDECRHVLGFRVPKDVAITGFDDIPQASWPSYDLTTLRQPVRRMAHMAVRFLTEQIDGQAAPGERRLLPAELMVRGSTR